MRFSVDEYNRYRVATQDPNLWPPRTLRQNGIAIGNADNATLQSGQPINITNPKSDPVFARSFSRAELGRLQTTKGLVLCFIADRPDPLITSNTSNLPTENLAVLPGTSIPNGTVTPALFLRVLDDSKMILTMKVRHHGLLADPA